MYEINIDGQSSRKTVTQSYRTCKMVTSCKKESITAMVVMLFIVYKWGLENEKGQSILSIKI